MPIQYNNEQTKLQNEISIYNKFYSIMHRTRNQENQFKVFPSFEKQLVRVINSASRLDRAWFDSNKDQLITEIQDLKRLGATLRIVTRDQDEINILLRQLSWNASIKYHSKEAGLGFGEAMLSPFRLIMHPIDTSRDVINAACHPINTAMAIKQSAVDRPAHFVGGLAGSVTLSAGVGAAIGNIPKGLSTLPKSAGLIKHVTYLESGPIKTLGKLASAGIGHGACAQAVVATLPVSQQLIDNESKETGKKNMEENVDEQLLSFVKRIDPDTLVDEDDELLTFVKHLTI